MSLWVQKSWFFLETKLKQSANEGWAYDTGDYIKSFYTKKVSKYRVRVWNSKEYSSTIEYGRKPWKYPPFDALVWRTARKFNLPWKTQKYDQADTELKSKVFMVARAIKNNGIEWKGIFKKTYLANKDWMTKIFTTVFK